MKAVSEHELAERRAMLEDPLEEFKQRLARVDDEVAKFESRVNAL